VRLAWSEFVNTAVLLMPLLLMDGCAPGEGRMGESGGFVGFQTISCGHPHRQLLGASDVVCTCRVSVFQPLKPVQFPCPPCFLCSQGYSEPQSRGDRTLCLCFCLLWAGISA
jgi:hypothetical protein